MGFREDLKREEAMESLPDLTRFGKGLEGKTKGFPTSGDDFEGKGFNVTLAEDWKIDSTFSGKHDRGPYMFKWTLKCVTPGSSAQNETCEIFLWVDPDTLSDSDFRAQSQRLVLAKLDKLFTDDLGIIEPDALKGDAEEYLSALSDVWDESWGRVINGGVKFRMIRDKANPTELKGPYTELSYAKLSELDEGPVEQPF